MDVKDKKILVIGQLKTSRTETLEEYFLKKVKKLGVIGLMSPFATHSESRCSLFENGEKVKEFCLPSFSIKSVKWWNRPLMSISFALYVWATFFAGLRLKEKFDLCVGVATFPSLLAILLKKIKKVNKVIYYCLDYYPPPPKFSFNSFIYPIYKALDRWLIKRVDVVWELTPRIAQAREIFAGIPKNSYPQQIVPLGYADYVQRKLNVEEREEWTLGFVGTLTENQGLQMVITAMPKLIKKFPKIKVRVIGHGPYAPQLKQMVKENGMEDHFIFHGFVKDDEEVFDILSRCMVGLATWTGDKADNSLYADPGKPKLYALLDLPIIITSAPWVAKLISDLGAGEMINYDVDNFVDTVERLFSNKERVQSYLEGIQKFRPYCLAENIFNTAFEEAKHIDKIQEDVSVSRFRKERMQNKEAEKEFYDNLNQSIARVDVDAEHQVKHQEDVLDRAIKFIERQLDLSSLVNVNILEVGSDGMFTSALRKSYPNLTINSFLGDIAFAQLKNFKDDIECSKVNLDLEFLPFQTNSFDFVFLNGVLHHLPSLDRCSGELMRVARRNIIAINEPCGDNPMIVISRIVSRLLSRFMNLNTTINETMHSMKLYRTIFHKSGASCISLVSGDEIYSNNENWSSYVSYIRKNLKGVIKVLVICKIYLQKLLMSCFSKYPLSWNSFIIFVKI